MIRPRKNGICDDEKREIAALVDEGWTVEEIADHIGIYPHVIIKLGLAPHLTNELDFGDAEVGRR